jgi:hypothetical protein
MRMSRKLSGCLIALLVVATATIVRAQCPTVCGDYNASGGVTPADIFEFTAWFYQGGSAPQSPRECWDIDGFEIITNRDLVWLTRSIVDSFPMLDCDSLQPELPIPPTSDFYFS